MCGICGIIDYKRPVDAENLGAMISSMRHRGPDHMGQSLHSGEGWHSGLGHARLSVIDLSTCANQPMSYGSLTIVFNGEVYNFREIRRELETLGHAFGTDSDTEVVLHSFSQWGIRCVDRFIGMFAFAVLDTAEQNLWLVRDRTGVKPLHYYLDGDTFMFASELKALRANRHFDSRASVDRESLALYFKLGYIPAPLTIYSDARKLEPARWMKVDLRTRETTIRRYWNVADYFGTETSPVDFGEAADRLEQLLVSACGYRMVADVPVGLFLSGGYDSCGVAALLQKDRTEKLRTFTIGFAEGNNEAPAAAAVARYLGTEHTEYTCTGQDAAELVQLLPEYYDEPFADPSAIPTMLVCRLARESVAVALSADGGDEIFAGYGSYLSMSRNSRILALLPERPNRLLGSCIRGMSGLLSGDSFARSKVRHLGEMAAQPAPAREALTHEAVHSLDEPFYRRFLDMPYPAPVFDGADSGLKGVPLAQYLDFSHYLPDDVLVKVDRAAMSVSLEGREPLLDHRLIEFAASLPPGYRFDGQTTKRIFREVVHRHIPAGLLDRRKSGFGVPLGLWLAGDLKPFADEYLSVSRLSSTGFFNVAALSGITGKKYDNNTATILWRVLQFQMWADRWL